MMHAILFHRLFGLVKPKTFDILDVTLVRLALGGLKNREPLHSQNCSAWCL